MDIDKRFIAYVEEHKLFTKKDKVLVAVSGGRDSMLLLTLLHRSGVQVEVAHCNFQLRECESDGDEELVAKYAQQLGIKLHIQRFDTIDYADKHRISIQMAARELRYSWFETIRLENECKYIAVAQHKNDHVETVLFNLSRGTGLTGLQGILPKRNHILRPLLFLESGEVLQAVEQLGIPYRDDASNFSNKYARNKIRLDIIPQFEQLNPEFIQIMDANIARFQDAQQVLSALVVQKRDELFVQVGAAHWEINKDAIVAQDSGLLYFLFAPFGFSKPVLADLIASMDKEPGRVFNSDTHELLLDRSVLQLREIGRDEVISTLNMEEEDLQWKAYRFKISRSDDVRIEKESSIALLDYDKLIFPLTVRSWQEGDVFQPLGMKGKKKISDFFIQKKINLFEKKKIPIWLNGNGELLWITNYQIDDRYKITENTQKVLKLACNISKYGYK